MTENFYTDAQLREDMVSGSPGAQNSAPYLLTVPEDMRPMVVGEAHRRRNMSPDWTFSGAVHEECKNFNQNPDAYRQRVQDAGTRTREVQAWERTHGTVASPGAYAGRPGEPISALRL